MTAPTPDPLRAASPAVLRAMIRFHREQLRLTHDMAIRARILDSIHDIEAILAEKMAEPKEKPDA